MDEGNTFIVSKASVHTEYETLTTPTQVSHSASLCYDIIRSISNLKVNCLFILGWDKCHFFAFVNNCRQSFAHELVLLTVLQPTISCLQSLEKHWCVYHESHILEQNPCGCFTMEDLLCRAMFSVLQVGNLGNAFQKAALADASLSLNSHISPSAFLSENLMQPVRLQIWKFQKYDHIMQSIAWSISLHNVYWWTLPWIITQIL